MLLLQASQCVTIAQVAPTLLAWVAARAATAQLANIPLPQQLSTLPPALPAYLAFLPLLQAQQHVAIVQVAPMLLAWAAACAANAWLASTPPQ